VDLTVVGKSLPTVSCTVCSTCWAIVDSSPSGESKATLPLDKTVLTSPKPADSRHSLSTCILRFVGLTPRRKATYLGIGLPSRTRNHEAARRSGGGWNELSGRSA